MSTKKSKHEHLGRYAKAISAVTWVIAIVLIVIYLIDVLNHEVFNVGNFGMGLVHVVMRWPWLVIIFIGLLVCAIALNSAVAMQHKTVAKQSAAKQLSTPEACVSCGQPLKKGSRRCSACGYAWCLNCGAWSAPGASRCKQCDFVLPAH